MKPTPGKSLLTLGLLAASLLPVAAAEPSADQLLRADIRETREWVGILMWPAVVFHAVLTLLLARAWFKPQEDRRA